MSFYGADTEALRAHGELTSQGAKRLGQLCAALVVRAHAIAWEGKDAESFRSRCLEVTGGAREVTARLEACAISLATHADQQDRTSQEDGDSARDLRSALDGLGLLDLFPGGEAASPTQAVPFGPSGLGALFSGSPLSDPTGGLGGVLQNTLTTPIGDEDFARDESTTASGSHGTETGGTTTTTGASVAQDGTRSLSITVEEALARIELAGHDGTASLTRASEAEMIQHPDGSVTFVFDVALTGEGEAAVDARGVEVGIDGTAAASEQYAVTLPPGATLEQALAVDPTDPSSIPAGGSVTMTTTLSAELGASVGYRDVGALRAGVSGSEETVTTIARSEDGNLTVDTGPGSVRGINYGLQIGPDQAHVSIKGSEAFKTTTVEHLEVDATAEGDAAARDMILSGKKPDPGAAGVVDQYTDTIRSTASAQSVTAHAEGGGQSGTIGLAHENAQPYDIQRDYPDGSFEREQRVAGGRPYDADSGEPYAIIESSSEGPSTVEVRYTQHAGSPPSSFHDVYDVPYDPGHDQEIRIALSRAEMDAIHANHPEYGGDDAMAMSVILASDSEAAHILLAEYNSSDSNAARVPGDPLPSGAAPGYVLEEGQDSSIRHHDGAGPVRGGPLRSAPDMH